MEKEIQEVIDLLEKPLVAYTQQLLKQAGMEITKEQTENLISNIGVNICKRKKVLS